MPSFVSSSSSTSSSQTTSVLKETTSEAKSMSSRTFGSSMDESVRTITSIDAFLDFIAAERLRSMPHRGSKWDRVYAYAAFFASQVELFTKAAGDFIPHSGEASRVIFTNLHLLLQNGHVDVLVRLFVVYYNLGLVLASLVTYNEFFSSSTEVQSSLSVLFANVVRIVVGMGTQFGQASSSSAVTVSSEVSRAYGSLIDSTYSRRDLIFNYMWSTAIISEIGSSSYQSSYDIEAIRAFLSPSDRIVKSLISNAPGSKGFIASQTCEWMQSYLMEFVRSKEKVFIIQGKAGSGKTMLSSWLAERLQRSEGRKAHHDVVSFAIERDISSQTSLVAVAKGILLQLLDRNVGSLAFYRAIVQVIEHVAKSKPVEVEQSLWHAINVALSSTPDNTMLLVDGIDQLEGGEPSALKLLDHLHHASSKHAHVRAIALGQPLSKATSSHMRSVTIEPSMTVSDIRSYVHTTLFSIQEFRSLKASEKEKITDRLAKSADGSFVWAEYSLEILRRQKTVAGMLQTLDSLPKNLTESLTRLQSMIDMKSTDTRSLLAWLLAAQRPLTLDEIKAFFEIDLGKCEHKPRFSDVEQDVLTAVGPIVNITGGVVRFKHDTIRSHFVHLASSVKDYSNTGDFPFMVKEAHYDLSTRCVAYVKLFVTRRVDPEFDLPSPTSLTDTLDSYVALDYSSTYWMSHFFQSPMYDPSGKHKLVPEFRNCFPSSSVLLAQIEGSVWPQYAIDWYELSLTIRHNIAHDTLSVVQSTINVARTYQALSNHTKATTYYFQAYTLVAKLLGEDSDLLVKIAMAYLTVSSVTTITERNEVAIQREDMLKRVITLFKRERGVTHTTTVTYLRLLAELYTSTRQYDLAVDTWKEVYEIYVQKYGEHSTETTTVYKTLETTISKSSRKDVIKTITTRRNETTKRDLDVTDKRRTQTERDTYDYYASIGDWARAEQTLVDSWRSVSDSASRSKDTSLLKRKYDLTVQYVKFLRQQKREDEARTILQGVYSESSTEIQSQTIATSLLAFASEMRSLHMTKIARSMFQSLTSYYQKSGVSTSTEAVTASRELQETTETIVQQAETTAIESSTSTDETTLTELFESLTTMSSSTSSTRFQSIIRVSQQLSIFYLRQQQYSDAYRVCSQALAIMWPYFITRQGTVRLASEYQKDVVELALRMGEVTWAQRQVLNTEDLYVTLYKATKATLKLTDELYTLVFQTLSDFYDQTYQIQKFVDLNRELYEDQKTQFGATNTVTIKTSYTIAKYLNKQGKTKYAEPFYYDVYTVLVKDDVVSYEATAAVEALLIIYQDDGRWEPAEKVCRSIWTTWTKRGSEARFSQDLIQRTYETYSYILREVKKVSYQERYQLAKTYYETSEKVFGAKNELTLQATIEFAQVCESSEEHRKESLQIYERAVSHSHAFKSSATTSTTTSRLLQTVTIARKSLARMYTKESTSSESAQKFVSEEYQSARSSYGATDQRSLSSLSQYVEYASTQKKTELTQQSLTMLQSSVVETITTEKSQEVLIESATTLAQSYKQLNQTETAWSLIREIRRQIVTGNYKPSGKFTFTVEGTDRRSYIFVIAFGQVLRGMPATQEFSTLMADLMTETLLYQAYYKAVNEKASFTTTFTHGARLATFYQNKQRGEDYNRIWTELFELFATTMHGNKQSATLKEFFSMVLQEIFEGRYDTVVPEISAQRVHDKLKKNDFQGGYEFAQSLSQYMTMTGGWHAQNKVEAGMLVSLYLMGRSGAPAITDAKLRASAVETSRTILAAVLRAARDLNVRFIQMPMQQINDIVALLGEQQNYTDLEWLLTELWESRESQSGWDSVTIVYIGLRLVEVRFATGRREAAIHLCEDISYNVRRVWGASDAVTLQFFDLLASLFSASGEHSKALGVYEETLRSQIIAVEEDGETSPSAGAETVKVELELARRSFQRAGGFGSKADSFKELYGQLAASFGDEKAFSSVPALDKWNAKEKPDDVGVWKRPASFEFVGAKDLKHKNNLRKTSGLVGNGYGSKGGRSVSLTYSKSSVNGS